MPQEHHVLRCVSCETFQVHIVKKVKKWECKICGTKQSVKRNYGRGSGKDCRNQVMKLNEVRILKGETSKVVEDTETFEEVSRDELQIQKPGERKPFNSKWTEFLEENISTNKGSDSEEENISNCVNEVFEKKKKRTKMPKNSHSRKKICSNFKSSDSSDFNEINDFFSPLVEDCFGSKIKNKVQNNEQCFAVNKVEKVNYKEALTETKSDAKTSKYAKYLDEENEDDTSDTQAKKLSNIFSSNSDDLDNILNF